MLNYIVCFHKLWRLHLPVGEGVTYFSTEKRFIQVEDYSVSEGQLWNLYHNSLAFLHRRQRRKVSHCQC